MDKVSLLKQAQEIVENQIRPMIQSDGGDIEVVDVTDQGVLQVRMLGACTQCAASATTLSLGVEAHIKDLLPEITSVQQVQ
jgi:Fe-S cluster biogenesis protein NfuA